MTGPSELQVFGLLVAAVLGPWLLALAIRCALRRPRWPEWAIGELLYEERKRLHGCGCWECSLGASCEDVLFEEE